MCLLVTLPYHFQVLEPTSGMAERYRSVTYLLETGLLAPITRYGLAAALPLCRFSARYESLIHIKTSGLSNLGFVDFSVRVEAIRSDITMVAHHARVRKAVGSLRVTIGNGRELQGQKFSFSF